MSEPLRDAVLALVAHHREGGITMGKIVDRLVVDGAGEEEVELEIWELIRERRLTPHGFVCRKVRKGDPVNDQRSYEFVLIPWSRALDAQLELDLGRNR